MQKVVGRPATVAVIVAVLTLSCLFVVPPSPIPVAEAAVPHVYDQFPGPYSFERDEVSDNNRLAQSFVASDNYLATEIRLYIMDVGFPNVANVTIMSDSGTSGPSLPLTNASGQGQSGAVDWISFVLATPWLVNASSTYWIVLDSSEQQNQGYEWAKRTSTPTDNKYPNGMAASCSGSGCGNWNLDTYTDYLFMVVGIVGPSLDCAIEVDSSSAGAGDPLNYTVHYDNMGSEYASVVWMNLTMSMNLSYVADDSGSVTSAPNWTFFNVAVGAHSFVMTGKVGLGVSDGDILKASLTLQYADNSGIIQEDHACEVATIARVPSLSLSKTVIPLYSTQGGSLLYTISFENSGSRPASKVWINDTLPDSLIFKYDTASNGTGPSNTSSIFRRNTTNLNIYAYEFENVSQGIYRFELYVTIALGVKNGTEIENRATLSYTDSSRRICGPIFASATARVMGASIRVKSFVLDTPVAPTDIVRYQIVFNNEGTAQSAYTWINDTLPLGVTYQSDTADQEHFFHNSTRIGRTIHYLFWNLPPGLHDFTITVVVDLGVVDGQVLENQACLAYTEWDSTLLLGSCSQSSAIVMIPMLTMETTGPAKADPGDTVAYRIYLNNTGSGTARSLWVNVSSSSELGYYYEDSSLIGGIHSGPWEWNFSNVKPGARIWNFIFILKPGVRDGHIVAVNYSATYTDYKGRPFGDMLSSISTIVTAPVVDLDLVQNKTEATRNDLIVYTIYFNNTGNGTAGSVWLNNTISELTELKSSSNQWVGSSGVMFTWHFVGVTPGFHSMTITVRVDNQAPAGATLINNVEMQYEDANGNPVDEKSSSISAKVIDGGIMDGNNGNPPASYTNLLWILVFLLLVSLAAMWLFVGRKFYGLGVKNRARIDELFLLHRSGELIRHHSRSLNPEVDSDVLSAMLVAVQNFVRESFKFRAGDLEELKFGNQKIVLINGQQVIIAAVVSGPFPQRTVPIMRRALKEIESRFGPKLGEWSGLNEDLPQIDDVLSKVFQNGNGK